MHIYFSNVYTYATLENAMIICMLLTTYLTFLQGLTHHQKEVCASGSHILDFNFDTIKMSN